MEEERAVNAAVFLLYDELCVASRTQRPNISIWSLPHLSSIYIEQLTRCDQCLIYLYGCDLLAVFPMFSLNISLFASIND